MVRQCVCNDFFRENIIFVWKLICFGMSFWDYFSKFLVIFGVFENGSVI